MNKFKFSPLFGLFCIVLNATTALAYSPPPPPAPSPPKIDHIPSAPSLSSSLSQTRIQLSWSSVEHAEYYPVHIYANGQWHHVENITGTGVNYDYQQRSWDPYTLQVKILACKAKPWWLFWAWWEHDRCSGWSNTVGISPASATQLTYQYDKLSRLTKVVIPDRHLEINYEYDAMGNRLIRYTESLDR